MSAQSINIQCGPTADDIKTLAEQVTSNRGIIQLAESVRNGGVIDQGDVLKISEKLRLKPEEVLAITKSLSSEIIVPETAVQQFAKVTRDYIDAAVKTQTFPASDSRKAEADTALKSGDIAGAERVIGSAIKGPPRETH